MAARDRFVTSVSKNEIEALDPSKYTAREIAFLKEKGYQWVSQWCLKSGG